MPKKCQPSKSYAESVRRYDAVAWNIHWNGIISLGVFGKRDLWRFYDALLWLMPEIIATRHIRWQKYSKVNHDTVKRLVGICRLKFQEADAITNWVFFFNLCFAHGRLANKWRLLRSFCAACEWLIGFNEEVFYFMALGGPSKKQPHWGMNQRNFQSISRTTPKEEDIVWQETGQKLTLLMKIEIIYVLVRTKLINILL